MRSIPVALLAAVLAAHAAQAQTSNKLIEAADGDVILVKDRAAIRVVRRMDADVRVAYNAAQGWLVLLVDQRDHAAGKGADGRVDLTFTFNEVTGTWPLGERWEGRATVDEYSTLTEIGQAGVGLNTGSGLIQLLSGRPGVSDARKVFRDQSAVSVLTFMGGGRGSGGNETFDQAEARQSRVAGNNAAGRAPAGTSLRMGVESRVGTSPEAPSYPPPLPSAPVRVGGNVRAPARIQDAEPVMPDVARQAGIRGVVIVEVTIGPDGAVTSAKVLRSIPVLDAAAIETVRKWRFEPTLLNGTPVPVITTVTVNFQ